MKFNKLIPFNGKVVQTKVLKELGYSSQNITKLMKDGIITRTRRGYYKVSIEYDVDINLMKYYLKNGYYDELIEYYDKLPIKDFYAYYYRFMCDILTCDYANAYKHLEKSCEFNKDDYYKFNLYAYILLLDELVELPKTKIDKLKKLVFNSNYSLDNYLECLLKKDYNNACKILRNVKNDNLLDKLDISILRDLSIKVNNTYKDKKIVKKDEVNEYYKIYESLFDRFYVAIMDADFERAQYIFNQIINLCKKDNIKDSKVYIIKDLFECFNYIITHPYLDLNAYKTNYKYNKDLNDNFMLAIKRNDYINALDFCNQIYIKEKKEEFEIYRVLLNRIYNFLNIRTLINSRNPYFNQMSLSNLVKNKKYKEALNLVNRSDIMEEHNKNIVTSLIESIIAIDNSNLNEV